MGSNAQQHQLRLPPDRPSVKDVDVPRRKRGRPPIALTEEVLEWKRLSMKRVNASRPKGYDLLNSDVSNFNVSIWYNFTIKNDTGNRPITLMRVPGSVNLVSSAYLRFCWGQQQICYLILSKKCPSPKLNLDWILLLFPDPSFLHG